MPKAYVQWLVTPTSNREFLKSDIELDTGFLTEVCQGVFADTPENRDNGNLNHSNAALYRGLLFLLTRLSTGPMFYWVLLHFIKVIITMIVFLASAMVCYNSPTSGIIRNAGGALDRLLAVKHKKKHPIIHCTWPNPRREVAQVVLYCATRREVPGSEDPWKFSSDLFLLSAFSSPGSTQSLTEKDTKEFPWAQSAAGA
jgi:hypothetical protein